MKIKAFFQTQWFNYLWFITVQLSMFIFVVYLIYAFYVEIDLYFIKILYRKSEITKEEWDFLQQILLKKSFNELWLFFLTCLGLLSCFYFLSKRFANVDVAFSKTLDKVIEFKEAMQKLNIKTADEQIDFISRSALTVYQTSRPLKKDVQTDCKVSIYTFFVNPIYRDVTKIKSLMIDNKLCLNYEDFEKISKEIENTMSELNQERIALMKQEIMVLKTKIEKNDEEIEQLRNTIKKAKKEHTNFKNETMLNQTLFHVACCMKKEAEEDTRYSREDIRNRFKQELEWLGQNISSEQMNLLKEQVDRNKSTDKGDFFLKESSIQYVRDLLKPYIQNIGGAPKKKAE